MKLNNYFVLQQVPLSHIPEAVYKTSVDWINQRVFEAVASFVLWLLDNIHADLAIHQATVKGSKKVAQPAASKSQVYFLFHYLSYLFWGKTHEFDVCCS